MNYRLSIILEEIKNDVVVDTVAEEQVLESDDKDSMYMKFIELVHKISNP